MRSRTRLSRHVHQHHPFDVVGWDGCVYPWAFNIADFEPIVGSIHQPPPVHQTFEGPGFVVCSFVPRPLDFHPGSVKAPYHHANTDSDELLFYADGDFMSRKGSGVTAGSLTYHPAGFVHGPQPGSVDALADEIRTEETAGHDRHVLAAGAVRGGPSGRRPRIRSDMAHVATSRADPGSGLYEGEDLAGH